MSVELLKDLHLLTRDGQLNADARRKLKQIRHLVGLLRPALDDALARTPSRSSSIAAPARATSARCSTSSCSAPPAAARCVAIEARPELSEQAAAARRAVRPGSLHASRPARSRRDAPLPRAPATSSPRCTRATPRPTTRSSLAIAHDADHVAVVPCCQAEVARQLERREAERPRDRRAVRASAAPPRARLAPDQRHPRPRARGPRLQGHGHRARRLGALGEERADPRQAREPLRRGARAQRCARCSSASQIEPALVRELAARGLDPRTEPPAA